MTKELSQRYLQKIQVASDIATPHKDDEDVRQVMMWRQVLIQAVLDASNPHLRLEDRGEALSFIMASIGVLLDDLEDVCHLARVEPSTFQVRAEKLIKKGRFKLRNE